ncbi:hypothetical protein LXL04_020787 [Taraxacum kok-saghyz]
MEQTRVAYPEITPSSDVYRWRGYHRYLQEFEALSALIPDQSEEQSTGIFCESYNPKFGIGYGLLILLLAIRLWSSPNISPSPPQVCRGRRHHPVHLIPPLANSSRPYLGNLNTHVSKTRNPLHLLSPTPLPAQSFNKPKLIQLPNELVIYPRLNGRKDAVWDCVLAAARSLPHNTNALPGDELPDTGEVRLLDLEVVPPPPLPSDGECSCLELCGVTIDTSTSDLKTLKVMGDILGFPALILIDSGATHNFISKKLARALGLELQSIGPLGIRLGDGNRVWVTTQCHAIPLHFGAFYCTVDALVYDLGPLDFILGIAWLKRLGDIKFCQNGEQVHLKDINSPLLSHSSLRSCLEPHLVSLTVDTKDPSALTLDQQFQLDTLRAAYTSLFLSPQGLPPVKTIEHQITLFAGQGPICVRPY